MSNFQNPYQKISWLERRLNALESMVRKVISPGGIVSSGTSSVTILGVPEIHTHAGTGQGGTVAAGVVTVADTAAQYTATNVEAALAEVLDALQAHEADTTDAHDASAISILDTANDFTATDVEGALAELQADNEAHVAAADPHAGYRLESADHTHLSTGAEGGALALTNHVPVMIAVPYATWSNMPAALTEIFAGTVGRLKADLTYYNKVRIHVNVIAAGHSTPALIRGQYSTDDSSYGYFDGASEPSVDISSTGRKVSSWITMESGAKADVWLRIVGLNGDGVVDPAFSIIAFEFKA